MSESIPQPTVPSPSPRSQFSLRRLLLLFVVLGSSLAVFGRAGIAFFLLAVGVAIYLNRFQPRTSWMAHALRFGCVLVVICLLLPSYAAYTPSSQRSVCTEQLREVIQALLYA